jgi:HEAT repeat protein
MRSGWVGLLLVLATGCGGDPLADAVAGLSSADAAVRRQAAQTLYQLRPDTAEALAALRRGTDDPDPEVRRWCCRTLGELPAHAAAAVPVLESRLTDPETAVRRTAAFALQKLEPDSTAYRAELLAAVTAGDGGVIVALGTLEPRPEWAVPALIGRLRDRRPGLRRLAAECLGALGIDTPEVRQALERLQADADDRVREAAAAALARLQSSPQTG